MSMARGAGARGAICVYRLTLQSWIVCPILARFGGFRVAARGCTLGHRRSCRPSYLPCATATMRMAPAGFVACFSKRRRWWQPALLVHISFIFAAAAWTGRRRRVSHTKSELQTDSPAAQEAVCFGLHRQISQGIDSTCTRLLQCCLAGYLKNNAGECTKCRHAW
jgi:hypothetical protein